MYHYSISATTNCEKAITGEIRQQMVDRMQAIRAMTAETMFGVHDGVEDKTLMPPMYYGFWRKKRLV